MLAELENTRLRSRSEVGFAPHRNCRAWLSRAIGGSGVILVAGSAEAHVKWFAPYIVGAAPQPLMATLVNVWFWTAILLVLLFFMATRAYERANAGQALLAKMDRATAAFWTRADDFMRVSVGTFFVAIFAVGGVYLTPDLATPSEWVSWFQLLIAAGLFWRRTMPLSAAGIIVLWAIALRDYDLFHLLDYLALGVGVASYLVLAASPRADWNRHRFEVLRWGVAIALMWSSLEKFAYPDWFYPLVVEKPYLTFGLPRDVFIPMAGVAEFTMGFGLLWTPLVRRLSALALLVIFLTAVWPFGRIDMIGHALIMSTILLIAIDPERKLHILPKIRQSLAGVPIGLAAVLIVFVTAYWGAHLAIYGKDGAPRIGVNEVTTHSYNPEEPHGPEATGGIGAPPDRTDDTNAAPKQ